MLYSALSAGDSECGVGAEAAPPTAGAVDIVVHPNELDTDL